MSTEVARVAVSVGNIAADKRYDYRVPQGITGTIQPGMRVLVPFGRGNSHLEAIVLEIQQAEGNLERLKPVEKRLDNAPVLDEEMLKLAVFLRNRLFSPLYSIVRTMLPAGYWFRMDTVLRPAGSVTAEDALHMTTLIPGAEKVVHRLFDADKPVSSGSLRGLLPQKQLHAVLSQLLEQGCLISEETVHTRIAERTAKLYYLAEGAEETVIRSANQRQVVRFLRQAVEASMKEIQYYTGVSDSIIRGMAKSGLLQYYVMTSPDIPRDTAYDPQEISLNEEQQAAYTGLLALYNQMAFRTALLQGVTGSGKTLVYMALMEQVLQNGEDAILLVPEIALTPQMTARFYRQFGDTVAVIHSALSVGDRYDAWQRIRSGKARIVIGTRSAIFAPVKNLGLIIIDEEHEHTYQSETAPRYHAREVAQYRAWRTNALLILGSATPTVVTAYRARTGEYAFFRLDHRFGGAELPDTLITDQREAFRAGYTGTLGPDLLGALSAALERGEQAILFLNRRGAARQLSCMACGYVFQCKNCSVAMSYHSANNRLICHQCGFSAHRPESCPECGQSSLVERGYGTQAVEQELLERFPEVRVIRMDSDTTGGKHSHEELLSAFREKEADVLLGTQMVAKGLDFPNVTLVGVIDADMSLYGAEYTSAEDTFALITQVIGRSGRGEKHGSAVIQTSAPQSEVIQAAAKQDYDRFYESEIALRRAMQQPPFVTLTQFTLTGSMDEGTYEAGVKLRTILRNLMKRGQVTGDILGPAAAQILKINNRYRYTLTLRTEGAERLREVIAETLRQFAAQPDCRRITIWAENL